MAEKAQPIVVVSFPRSGQHLLESCINQCCSIAGLQCTYCEFYNCCRQTPCACNCTVSKNHDFALDLKKLPTHKYVVLYRSDVVEQLEALYRYRTAVTTGEWNHQIFQPSGRSDVVQCAAFCKSQLAYYNGFVNKWVNRNNLVVEFSAFLKSPASCVRSVMRLMIQDSRLTYAAVQRVCVELNISPRNQLSGETRRTLHQAVLDANRAALIRAAHAGVTNHVPAVQEVCLMHAFWLGVRAPLKPSTSEAVPTFIHVAFQRIRRLLHYLY